MQMDKCPSIESLVVSDLPSQILSDTDAVPDHLLQADGLNCNDWRKAQMDNSLIQESSAVLAKQPSDRAVDTSYLKEWKCLCLYTIVFSSAGSQ